MMLQINQIKIKMVIKIKYYDDNKEIHDNVVKIIEKQ